MTKAKRPLLLRIAIWGLIAFLVAIPVGLAFVEYTTQPDFCNSCHIMEPYVKSWRQSAHAKVPCVDCHYEPGVLETLDGKFKAVNQVVKYVTNTQGTKPWAEVSDSSCMRSGCHSTRLLAGKVDFRIGRTSIPFDHGPHLLEMRRSKKLRCTSCHSQIVQGEHLTVTVTTCLLCHFKGAEEDPHLSECRTCHTPPKEAIDVGGFQFVHDEYLQRGVDCTACHADITQGVGDVPKRRCGSCHAVQEHIDRYGETEFLHRRHVTDHKVDCLECHQEMTHVKRPARQTAKAECGQCHQAGHGAVETFYRGEGGRGAPATPNPMYLARVGCGGCHARFAAGSHAPTPSLRAGEVSCLACHGPAYDGVLGRWQAMIPKAADEVAARVEKARAAAKDRPDLAKRLDDAAHDAGLVRADPSRGAHNPWFSRKLLESAQAAADAALGESPFPLGPTFPTQLECAKVCHMGIETREVAVEGTRFDHRRHVGNAGNDCDRCHTTETHGGVLPAARDCVSCHHGDAAPKDRTCQSCHAETDALLRGVGPDGEESVSMMAKVDCRECHGATPKRPVRASAQEQCNRCHGEKYTETVAEWTGDSDEWLAGAEKRLAAVRAKAAASGRRPASLDRAESLAEWLRRARPAHNVMLFEELKDAFDEAASAAESGK